MTETSPAVQGIPSIHPHVERISPDTVRRLITVKPGMCGHNSLFVGQIGDWTWETVSDVCGIDAFSARNHLGSPTYLSFYYFHLQGGARAHPNAWSFGDRLEVVSRVFDFGSESVLTLHRIRPVDGAAKQTKPIDPVEFYERPPADVLQVENFNRWISRSQPGRNEDLVKSSPVGLRREHLQPLPECYSPRRIYGTARQLRTFQDPDRAEWVDSVDSFQVTYPVDITRDVNGVGLLYFAAYFSIFDRGLLEFWRHQSRSDESFLNRIVVDQKVCYLGNADLHSVLRLTLRSGRNAADPAEEVINTVVEDDGSGRVIAVSTARLRTSPSTSEVSCAARQ